jgi:hypothetical protein
MGENWKKCLQESRNCYAGGSRSLHPHFKALELQDPTPYPHLLAVYSTKQSFTGASVPLEQSDCDPTTNFLSTSSIYREKTIVLRI